MQITSSTLLLAFLATLTTSIQAFTKEEASVRHFPFLLFLLFLLPTNFSLSSLVSSQRLNDTQFAQLGYQLTAPPREATVSQSLSTSASKFYSLSLTACSESLTYLPLLSSQSATIQSTPAYKDTVNKITEICNQSKISGVQANLAKTAAESQDVVGAQLGNKAAGKASILAEQGAREVVAYWKSL